MQKENEIERAWRELEEGAVEVIVVNTSILLQKVATLMTTHR